MSDTLNDLARNVALARQEEDKSKAVLKVYVDSFEAEESTVEARRWLKEASDTARQAEFDLRLVTLRAWETDGNKHQPGVTIRMVKKVIYAPQDALNWAIEHKMFLKLNETAFERFAKDAPPNMPFVMVNEEPTAAIDSDLSAFLKDGAA
jgi:hypothetical protein